MKCPKCGAEISDDSITCEYCDSPIPSNMRRSITGGDSSGKACCPKCGSSNIEFNREETGHVAVKKGTKIVRSTVGVCHDCGYTWYPEGSNPEKKKSRLWLWVLGWIFIFPVPATILLVRKKDMNPILKYGLIAFIWLLYIGMGSSRSSSSTTQPESKASTSMNQIETISDAYCMNDMNNVFEIVGIDGYTFEDVSLTYAA